MEFKYNSNGATVSYYAKYYKSKQIFYQSREGIGEISRDRGLDMIHNPKRAPRNKFERTIFLGPDIFYEGKYMAAPKKAPYNGPTIVSHNQFSCLVASAQNSEKPVVDPNYLSNIQEFPSLISINDESLPNTSSGNKKLYPQPLKMRPGILELPNPVPQNDQNKKHKQPYTIDLSSLIDKAQVLDKSFKCGLPSSPYTPSSSKLVNRRLLKPKKRNDQGKTNKIAQNVNLTSCIKKHKKKLSRLKKLIMGERLNRRMAALISQNSDALPESQDQEEYSQDNYPGHELISNLSGVLATMVINNSMCEIKSDISLQMDRSLIPSPAHGKKPKFPSVHSPNAEASTTRKVTDTVRNRTKRGCKVRKGHAETKKRVEGPAITSLVEFITGPPSSCAHATNGTSQRSSLKTLHTNPNAFGGSRPKYSQEAHLKPKKNKLNRQGKVSMDSLTNNISSLLILKRLTDGIDKQELIAIAELNRINLLKRAAQQDLERANNDTRGPALASSLVNARIVRSFAENYVCLNLSQIDCRPFDVSETFHQAIRRWEALEKSSGSGRDTESGESEHAVVDTFWRSVVLQCAEQVKTSMHKPKFREYCDNYFDRELSRTSTTFISTLLAIVNRRLEEDADKARALNKRRLVFGLKEIVKLLKLDGVKCVVVAPDLERVPKPGGLDQMVKSIIENAAIRNVPVIYGIRRNDMSTMIPKKRVNVSAIGILNVQGAEVRTHIMKISFMAHINEEFVEPLYSELLTLAQASRRRYLGDFFSNLNAAIHQRLTSTVPPNPDTVCTTDNK